jgi:hypothetical protein
LYESRTGVLRSSTSWSAMPWTPSMKHQMWGEDINAALVLIMIRASA